jgi:N utilization substance protein A
MNSELLTILDSIEREKGIEKETLFKAIEAALQSAVKKIIDKDAEMAEVNIDRETGEIKILSGGKEITSEEFGRIAAQTAKQVIIQKIREAEREVIYDDYHNRVGGIVSGTVHRFVKGDIIIDLGKTEAVLPRKEQIPRERYRQGERVRGYVLEVTKTTRGPEIILSRAHSGFIKKMFELEVPEIAEGIVEIKAIAREPGARCKMAVYSKDDKIDAVGACVGMRGNRVKNIVRELHGERIDVIRWNDELREYVKSSLSPAEVTKINIDKEANRIEIIVKDDQLSLAIGKHGQNVRIASKLVGYEIDIRGVTKAPEKEAPGKKAAAPKAPTILTLEGVGKKLRDTLLEAGYDTVEKVAGATVKDLTAFKGIGKKGAEKIIDSAKEKLKEQK